MIWVADVIVFGLWFWEVDDGGPFERASGAARKTPDFQFPQDENPGLARAGLAAAGLGLPLHRR